MARLTRDQAEAFAEALILKRAAVFFEEMNEGAEVDAHAIETDIKIDDEDWDLIKDLINTARVQLLSWESNDEH